MTDAVVIGAGPNGLVAANLLADAGWDVTVLEAAPAPGGAVRSGEITAPGFENDLFSSFYPLAAASKVLQGLALENYGLRWSHAPAVIAHPTKDGPAAVLSRDLELTAACLDRFGPGDGDAWRELYGRFHRISAPFVSALLGSFPPLKASAGLVARLGPRGALDLGRLALLPMRTLADETFDGDGGALLLTGNALHADVSPEGAGSGLLGWMMTALGQEHGFPVPEGGAQRLTEALVARLEAAGGQVVTHSRVTRVVIRHGRAVGVETANGTEVTARRAVVADCDAVSLYTSLVGPDHLPASLLAGLKRFHRGPGTVKIDWALSAPIPWRDPSVACAGTVHLGDSVDEMSFTMAQLAAGQVPSLPFVIIGQMTTADPTRSPPGTEAAWAYAHVPGIVRADAGPDGITGRWDKCETAAFVRRMEARIEAHAPGFGDHVISRHVFTPLTLEAENANLVGGDIAGGTAQLHQQLVFRPTAGLGRPETPVRGLYLASASAHPGGGVHGACGANAAQAALLHHRLRRWSPGRNRHPDSVG